MTQISRSRGLRALVCFALILFAWSHRHALTLTGFADDLGLLVELPRRAADHTLVADVLARVRGALWSGSTMWRPLPYASFALDAALWGNAPELWRVTNLLLHLACAAVVGLIAARVTRTAMAGVAGFAVFLLMPWSPEVTLWLVGRFDGWATLAVLLAVWFALRSDGQDRWLLASVVAGACAYASKESALVLPLWLVLILSADALGGADPQTGLDKSAAVQRIVRMMRSRWLLVAAHIALAVAYSLWRAHLFADASVNAYVGATPQGVMQYAARIYAHAGFAGGLAPIAPVFAWTAAIGAVSLLAFGWRGRGRVTLVAGGLLSCSVLAALALYFADAPHAGEGYRLYYLASVGFAMTVAAGLASVQRINVAVLVVLLVSLAAWQSRTAAEWTRASREMRAAQATLQVTAQSLPATDYGLVLMPDLRGHVPFARNAQGVMAVDALSKLVVFTPPQIGEWHALVQQDIVPSLTARTDAPPRPTRYFCFDPETRRLRDMSYWPPESLDTWNARWRENVRVACPGLVF